MRPRGGSLTARGGRAPARPRTAPPALHRGVLDTPRNAPVSSVRPGGCQLIHHREQPAAPSESRPSVTPGGRQPHGQPPTPGPGSPDPLTPWTRLPGASPWRGSSGSRPRVLRPTLAGVRVRPALRRVRPCVQPTFSRLSGTLEFVGTWWLSVALWAPSGAPPRPCGGPGSPRPHQTTAALCPGRSARRVGSVTSLWPHLLSSVTTGGASVLMRCRLRVFFGVTSLQVFACFKLG